MKNIQISFQIKDGYKSPYVFMVKAKSTESALKRFMYIFAEQIDYAEANGYEVSLEAQEV